MNNVKKIVVVVLAVMFLVFPINVSAEVSSDEIISFDEYYNEMRKLYAEYDITYEVLEKKSDIIFTRDILEKNLASSRQRLEAMKHMPDIYVNNIPSHSNINRIRSLMPYSYTRTKNVAISSPSALGHATFDITLFATANAQYDEFLDIKRYTCTQSGPYMNLKRWKVLSKDHILLDRKSCIVHFKIELQVEHNEAITGMAIGYTSTHDIYELFKFN